MKSAHLVEYLQIYALEQDIILFRDGSAGFGFDLTPRDVSCASDESLNETSVKMSQFLSSVPAHFDFQFVQSVTRQPRETLTRHTDRCVGETLATELARLRVQELTEQNNTGDLPFHSVRVYFRVPYVHPRSFLKWNAFMPSQKIQDITEAETQSQIALAKRHGDTLQTALMDAGLCPARLDATALNLAVYEQWNPSRPSAAPRYDPDDIRNSLLYSDVAICKDGFSIGQMFHKVITLKGLPDQSTPALASVMRSLPFDSQLVMNVHVPCQIREIESLQTQRRIAYSMVFGKKSGVSDIESKAKFQDLETLLEQMIAQGEKVFHVTLAVVLRSTDKETLDSQVAQTLAAFREMNGSEGLEESLAAFDIFCQMSVPNCRARDRMRRMKTSNLADLLPVFGPWRGHMDSSRILLKNRLGGLLSIDPFHPSLTNANQVISGGSGAGKSFLTNLFLLQMLKETPKVFFVDIGGSYQKLCENLGGQFVPLKISSGQGKSTSDEISINPFDLGAGEEVPTGPKIKFLVGLVELMTKEEDQERLPRLERSEIEDALRAVYSKFTKPRLSHLRDILLSHDDSSMQKIGRILNSWCGDTPFGKLVDKETSINFTSHLVAFDLKGMESYPDLQAVALYIITDLVWREVQRDRSTMKFLVFDECWKLLKSSAGLVFIEEVFRTFRKYYASAIAISQDIDDFAKSKIAGAILPNCSLKWVLVQQQSDKERLKQVLSLNDAEVELVNSLHQKKGFFSEAFLMAGENHCVAVVESTPLELWLATTDPRDLSAIEQAKLEFPTHTSLQILRCLADCYPNGFSNGPSVKNTSKGA